MSDLTPGQPMQPPEPGEQPLEPRSALAITGGVLVGLLAGFIGIPLMFTLFAGSSTVAGTGLDNVAFFVGLGAPLVLGIALLVPKSFRRAGAGLLLGLSVGLIVGSASCLGLVGLFATSYNA